MQYPMIAQPQYGFAPTMPMMAKGGSVADAQSVQSKGRGRDTMLVHMTPKEVGGLQALAMQHGGSLTINPQTGLPEAGFLENLLPTLLGVGLSFIPGVGPLAAAGITTAIQTARTGDLGQGLLAGLGAYGGASLGAGLSSAGAAAAPGTVAPTAGLEFTNAASPEFLASQGTGTATAAGAPSSLGTTVNPVTFGDTGAAIYGGAPSPAMEAANLAVDPMAVPGSSSRVLAPPSTTPPPATFSSRAAAAGRGVGNIFTEPGGFDKFIGKAAVEADPSKGIQAAPATGLGGGYGAAKTAAFAAAPALLATPEYDAPAPKEEESDYEGPYTPSARRVSYPGDDERRRTSEFTYFTPSNPVPFAEGGEAATSATTSPDVFVSPNEARAYQDIMNVQRLAGLPAIDPNRFSVMPGRSYEQYVYNPIEGDGGVAQGTGETDFGIKARSTEDPNLALSQGMQFFKPKSNTHKSLRSMFDPIENRESKPSDYEAFTPKGRLNMADYTYDPNLGGFVERRRPGTIGGKGFSQGGSVPQLENGGFVLTKKAVDGLGRGNNEKGQANAQRGLGAIPIRGAGAKRGPKAGVDDKIKTTIDGKRPALVSNGEAYVPKKQVAKKGGAKAFYALMKQAEKAADKRRRA